MVDGRFGTAARARIAAVLVRPPDVSASKQGQPDHPHHVSVDCGNGVVLPPGPRGLDGGLVAVIHVQTSTLAPRRRDPDRDWRSLVPRADASNARGSAAAR